MNLHAIAAPYVHAVNPLLPVTVLISTGYTTGADGTQLPSYTPPIAMRAQVQALSFRDIQQLSGLTLNGTRRAIYLMSDIDSNSRPDMKGGDLVRFPDGTEWLVAMALETWGASGSTDAWCKCACTLQLLPT